MDHRQSERFVRWASLTALLLAVGCGSAQPPSRRPSPPAKRAAATQFEMRSPDEVGSPAGDQILGALRPVAAGGEQPTPDPAAAAPLAGAPPEPLKVAPGPPRPRALSDGKLALSGGLILHHVPAGVAVRAVDEQRTGAELLEIVDRRGRRLALLKETSFGRAALPQGSSLLEQAATTRSRARREDWDRTPVEVVIDTFHSETHLYTLERRARGTDWIWSGLELATNTAESSRAE